MGQIKVYIVFCSFFPHQARQRGIKIKRNCVGKKLWINPQYSFLFCHFQTKPSVLLLGYYGIFHNGQLIITILTGIDRSFYILCVL